MKSNSKIKVFSISALCAAILAGCGGGDASFTSVPGPGTGTTEAGNDKTNTNEPEAQPLASPEINVANATEISGQATAGSQVKVGIYDAVTNQLTDIKAVTANGLGKWTIPTDDVDWADGAIIAAKAVKQNQSSPISTPYPLDIAIPVADQVKFKELIGDQNVLSGTVPAGTVLRLDIDNDGVIDKAVEPDEFGNWQVELGAGASGERVTIKLVDAAGNQSAKVSKNLPVKNKVGGGQGDSTLPGGGEVDPTINKFLTTDTADIGQQNSPIVTSLRFGRTLHGAVKFNQPGIVSEVCKYGDGECVSTRFDRALKNANEEVAAAQEKLDEKKKQVGASYVAEEQAVKEAKEALKELEDALPKQNEVVIRDINNFIVKPVDQSTIDLQSMKSSLGGNYLILQDAGIVDIDQKRENGQLRDYGGSIGREFNRVLLFSDPLEEYFVDAYFRDPAAAGWSYQTFGAFSSLALDFNRDLNIGYQSFGQQTPVTELPANGKATYIGLSHAYYNQDQVTSHNAITVDFSDKSLMYKTTDTPILHTFEGGLHVIEEKPDYAVSGEATWKASNRFEGTVTTDSGLEGTIKGQFYGPDAQEIGGVYGLWDEGKQDDEQSDVHYIGGFGAKR